MGDEADYLDDSGEYYAEMDRRDKDRIVRSKRVQSTGMICICREVDKNTGRVAAHPLDIEVTDVLLSKLGLRSQFNPELTYYVTTKAHYVRFKDIIIPVLKRKKVTEADIKRVGGIVQI